MRARYGVIGWPVAHSRSPLIHNYWLQEAGIDAVYEPVAVPLEVDFRAKLEELREQGFATIWRGREKLQQGKLPAQEMVEGLLLAISGALLVTPGFITDVIGFAGLLPFTRVLMVKLFLSRVTLHNGSVAFGCQHKSEPPAAGDTIDGEFWDSENNLRKPK